MVTNYIFLVFWHSNLILNKPRTNFLEYFNPYPTPGSNFGKQAGGGCGIFKRKVSFFTCEDLELSPQKAIDYSNKFPDVKDNPLPVETAGKNGAKAPKTDIGDKVCVVDVEEVKDKFDEIVNKSIPSCQPAYIQKAKPVPSSSRKRRGGSHSGL